VAASDLGSSERPFGGSAPWERNRFLPESASRVDDALHHLALALPDVIACEDAERSTTFAELERRVHQVARTILDAYPAGADSPAALVSGTGAARSSLRSLRWWAGSRWRRLTPGIHATG